MVFLRGMRPMQRYIQVCSSASPIFSMRSPAKLPNFSSHFADLSVLCVPFVLYVLYMSVSLQWNTTQYNRLCWEVSNVYQYSLNMLKYIYLVLRNMLSIYHTNWVREAEVHASVVHVGSRFGTPKSLNASAGEKCRSQCKHWVKYNH